MRIDGQRLACLRIGQAVGVKAPGLRSPNRDRDDLEEEGTGAAGVARCSGTTSGAPAMRPCLWSCVQEGGVKPGRDGERIPPRGVGGAVWEGTFLGSLQVGSDCWDCPVPGGVDRLQLMG